MILFALLLAKNVSAKLNLPNKWILILLFAFYGIHLASAFWSLNFADSIFESQKIGFGITCFIWFYHVLSDKKKELTLAQSIVISALILSLFCLFELLLQSNFTGPYNFALSGHENLLSSLLFLFLPLCLFVFRKSDKPWKIISAATGIIAFLLIILIGTRSVYLGILGASFFFLIIKFIQNKSITVQRITLILSGAFVMLGLSLILNYGAGNNTSLKNETSSLTERLLLWDKTTQLIKENPFLGVGAGNWQYNYSKFSVADIDKANFFNIVFKRPHNDFLWVLAEVGIPGLLILLLLITFISWHSITHILKTKNSETLVFLAGLFGLMIISFFSFPKERISHICLTAVIIVFLLKNTPAIRNGLSPKKVNIPLILSIGLIFNIMVGFFRLNGEFYTRKSIFYQDQNNPVLAIENGQLAISTLYSSDPTGTPIYSYIGWGYNATGEVDKLYAASRLAVELSPFDYKALSNYGSALIRNYQLVEAKKVLLEAYRINPNYEPTTLNLSVVAFNQGDYSAALNWLKQIPNYELKYAGNLARIRENLD